MLLKLKSPSISILRFYFLDLTMYRVPRNLYIYIAINSHNLEKIQLEFEIGFSFLHHVFHLINNFMPSILLSV